ncbi:MAG TPA: RNA methyltransferase [Methylibium sp.]|uniref:TrmH family RNA methyltransferase n=1 Tax=Methylibium sp. TaxID=2067992 RepID=UPI002DB7C35B|nr:RNA methyltransferase [Methylibium sp.]HEU4460199.1 RNA methyltransferase [Methylibium sp.]
MSTAPHRHLGARDNPLLVRLRKLAHDPGGYRRHGGVWLEGEHLCAACSERGPPVRQAVLSESGWARAELQALARVAETIAVVPDAQFAKLSALESPASIGFLIDPGALFTEAIEPGVPTVVLDRLQDAGNVGSILRSAAAFGVRQVVALKGTAALASPKVLRAGMGAHFSLRLVEGVEPAALDAIGLPLVATSSHAPRSLLDGALPKPCAWVFGHEGQGVAAAIAARCSELRRIPQPGGEESLNVAAAAAVCLYESMREA